MPSFPTVECETEHDKLLHFSSCQIHVPDSSQAHDICKWKNAAPCHVLFHIQLLEIKALQVISEGVLMLTEITFALHISLTAVFNLNTVTSSRTLN